MAEANDQNNYSNRSRPPPPAHSIPKLHLPFLTRLKLFLLSILRPLYIHRDGTINRRLLSLLDFKASAPATKFIAAAASPCYNRRRVCVSTSDVTIDAPRNLWFRLFTPAQSSSPLPLIVYYHGGGFTNYAPDSQTFDYLCTHIAAKVPAIVASVNYRLAPEQRYPVQYEDGFDALKFIDQVEAALPAAADPQNCFIAGDSAGGNIAHHVAVRACHSSRDYEFSRIKIQGLLLLQPFFGGEERTESELRLVNAPMLNAERTDWMWSCFLPEGANRDHPAARVFGGGGGSNSNNNMMNIPSLELANIVEFPRVLVVQGGFDPLLDWQKQYVEWLKNCGKQVESIHYPNAFHGFYAFPELPEFQLLISCVSDFVQKQLL